VLPGIVLLESVPVPVIRHFQAAPVALQLAASSRLLGFLCWGHFLPPF
jgi:hypothetical protein